MIRMGSWVKCLPSTTEGSAKTVTAVDWKTVPDHGRGQHRGPGFALPPRLNRVLTGAWRASEP